MLCPPPHYMKVEPYVLKLLEEGNLGEIRHVALHHVTSSVNDPQAPLHWRQRADLQGINMLDVGIMGEVLNKWFGPLKRVSALGKTWVTERAADRDGKTKVELPDAVTVVGEFRSGATFTALFSGAAEGGRCSMTIHGSKGTLRCHHNEPCVWISRRGEERKIDIPAEQIGTWKVEEQFLRAVEEGRKGSPSFADGVRYMAFTQAISDSLRQGALPVAVQDVDS